MVGALVLAAGGWTTAYVTSRAPTNVEHVAPASASAKQPTNTSARAATNADAFSISTRLTEALSSAELTSPHLREGLAKLRGYWRHMPLVWNRLTDERKSLGTSLVIRTSDEEKAWVVPTKSGKAWAPSARVWNMSEGSFDQRESIFMPTPTRLGFHQTIPTAGRLDFSAGVALPTKSDVHFRVEVSSSHGVDHLCETVVPAAETGRAWKDVRCDLAKYAGEEVTLSLVTEGAPEDIALALAAHPTVSGKGSRLPYNVLFIVVDALRPDVLASFHDDATDAKKLKAKHPPLDAWLPSIPGLTPVLDELTKTSVRFTQAYSGGAWTRPGTLSMLSGARSSELRVDTMAWVLAEKSATQFYESDPPLLPLLFRKEGAATRAFVNNFFMGGYASVGIDMGFERVYDERYRREDTDRITDDAITWLKGHADERFFAFCNFNSPHEPWEPPKKFLDRVPPPPKGPSDETVRKYMAEAAKDDEAIGRILATIDELKLRESTLIVVTADHGETLSAAHDGRSKLDNMEIRFHHAVGDYEETTRIPIILSLPGVLPKGANISSRVRNVDLAPTLLELEHLEGSPKFSGRSLLPLIRGEKEPERTVVSEGRGMRAVLSGRYRLLLREGAAAFITKKDDEARSVLEELYDLDEDPGERVNLAKSHPEVVADLKARLLAENAHVPMAGTTQATEAQETGELQIRFSAGALTRRISGKATVDKGTLSVEPVGIAAEGMKAVPNGVELGFTLGAGQSVGLNLKVEPTDAAVHWEWFLDDAPWPKNLFFAGPYGLLTPEITSGLESRETRRAARAYRLPTFMPSQELGLFAILKGADNEGGQREDNGGGEEMSQILKDWGYAKDSRGKKR